MKKTNSLLWCLSTFAGIAAAGLWTVYMVWCVAAAVGAFFAPDLFDSTLGKWLQTLEVVLLWLVVLGVHRFVNPGEVESFDLMIIAAFVCFLLSVVQTLFLWFAGGAWNPGLLLLILPSLQFLSFTVMVNSYLGKRPLSYA